MSKPEKSAAILTLQKPGAMTKKGRAEIAAWLRKQASNLVRYGEKYNDTGPFRAKYYYE